MGNNENYQALELKVEQLSKVVETLTNDINQIRLAHHYLKNPIKSATAWTNGKPTRKAQAVAMALVAEGMSQRQASKVINVSTAALSLMLSDKYSWSIEERDKPIPTLTDLLLEIKETTDGE